MERFEIDEFGVEYQREDGDWVRYDDAQKRLEAHECELAFIADRVNQGLRDNYGGSFQVESMPSLAEWKEAISGLIDGAKHAGAFEFRAAAEAQISHLRAEVERLRVALTYYASDEAWTIEAIEGPTGDYGDKARAALEPKP